jgi:DNA-binding winged helix-turn-helix (wHTH) protein/tetratricopeptide (TPR) repeat protein
MSKPGSPLYKFGPFTLNASEKLLFRDGQRVTLKPKVFDLLLVLVENNGHVIDKNELMKRLWPDTFVEESNLSVSIFALRKALGENHYGQSYIETVPRRGYRFVANVTETTGDQNAGSTGISVHVTDKFERTAHVKSLAVLPFKLLGSPTTDEYLGLGLADALITRLTNLSQIRVRPTSAVMDYTGPRDIAVAGHELKVDALLDGSVQRQGKRIRVTTQLVDVRESAILWAENFDENFVNIFSLEDSFSSQLVKALELKLTGREKGLVEKRFTESPDAYQAYLKGVYFLSKRTPKGIRKSFELFEQAITIDSSYAKAYAGLADAYYWLSAYNLVKPRTVLPKAEAAALKALQLDDSLPEAHTALAVLLRRNWSWASAENEFKRAIALNPNDPRAHHFYSVLLRIVGRFDESWAEIKKAQELDPISLSINLGVANLFYAVGEYDGALDQLKATVELDPNFANAHLRLGTVYVAKGMFDEAIKQYQTAERIWVDQPDIAAYLAHVYALSGKKTEALQILAKLRRLSDQGYDMPYFMALIYSALDDNERAFAWLERAYDEHDEVLGGLRTDPMLDGLRADPRFAYLVHRVGLPSETSKPSLPSAQKPD